MIEVDWALYQRVEQVCGAGCHLREGNDHLGTAVPCEGQGWEREQEPIRLPQPFFVPCAAVPVMEFPHSHSKSVWNTVGMLVWPVCTGFPDLTQQCSQEFCLSGNSGALVSACGSCQVPGWISGLQV